MKTYKINNKQYITPNDLAKQLKKPVITIYKRIERGHYQTIKIGRQFLIDLENVKSN